MALTTNAIFQVAIIERVGRKALLVYGFAMMIFWCLAMTIFLIVLENAEVSFCHIDNNRSCKEQIVLKAAFGFSL